MEILSFKPLLTPFVWGGEKIAPFKGIVSKEKNIGESWEISGVEGLESIVDGGSFDGLPIRELLRLHGEAVLGKKLFAAYGADFPLLVKFIDAASDLSIQVHPNDALAAELHGPGFRGKTEMWYVVAAEPGAHLLSGLSRSITPEEYEARVKDGSITEVLARYDVRPGDVFFLPAGRIHAICSGCFIAEIQQTSDLTYRIFDYNRLGLDGKPRQLHLEQAKRAIDYKVYDSYRTDYTPRKNERVELVSCPFFTTSLYEVDAPVEEDLSQTDSFLIVICVEGGGELISDGSSVTLSQGKSVLIPAENKHFRFTPSPSARLLTSRI